MGKDPKAQWICRRCGIKGHIKRDCLLPEKAKPAKHFEPKEMTFGGKKIAQKPRDAVHSVFRSFSAHTRRKVKKIRKAYLEAKGHEIAADNPELQSIVLESISAMSAAKRLVESLNVVVVKDEEA